MTVLVQVVFPSGRRGFVERTDASGAVVAWVDWTEFGSLARRFTETEAASVAMEGVALSIVPDPIPEAVRQAVSP